jgi:hypothetical protein
MSDVLPDPGRKATLGVDDLLRFAQMHGETTDTRQWVDNLERMLGVAWDIMTEDQRRAFREHADVLAIAEAAGETPPG